MKAQGQTLQPTSAWPETAKINLVNSMEARRTNLLHIPIHWIVPINDLLEFLSLVVPLLQLSPSLVILIDLDHVDFPFLRLQCHKNPSTEDELLV